MSRLELSLLGPLIATLDGQAITGFESVKVRALLAYLAAEADRPHRRESLAALLWPDWPQQSAMSNLRYALADLRKNIGDRDAQPPFLLITRESIQLNRESGAWVDVTAYEDLSGLPDLKGLESAITLYRGAFLEGLSLPDSAPFEQWLLTRREGLQRQALGALFSLAEAHAQQGDLAAALPYARRQVAVEPWREPGQQQLMRLLALNGQRSEALAQYEACRKALADELNVEPSAETKRLYEAIRDEDMQAIQEQGIGVAPSSYALTAAVLPPEPGESPFKGLQYFDVADAALFFGREALTARLVGHIREMVEVVGAGLSNSRRSGGEATGSHQRLADNPEGCCFLAVVGASGSGKSSVVRAGVVPALMTGEPLADGTLPPEGSPGWHMHVFTPTAHPLEALAVSLTQEAESLTAATQLMDDFASDSRSLNVYAQRLFSPTSPGLAGKCRLLLVVDQFEELFTLCRSETERETFVDNLLKAVQGGGPTQVIVVLRADFYGHCAQYPLLRQALCSRQEYIGPMEASELRRAIEEPAKQNGWEFEAGLVDLILRDVGASADHPPEPGALPLLEHALLETWQRRSGRTLTHQGYVEAGGVHGAIAKTAESVFAKLTPEQQMLARRIFLRLTELGEGTQDTRRRAPLSELSPTGEGAPQVADLLRALADARLITLSEDTAEVAHEALIREWPALRLWLNEDREGLRLHRRLTEAAEAWAELERDAGELYRGARLAQAAEWAEGHPGDLNALETEFLQASRAHAEREAADREAQRQRELDSARKLAETERLRAEQQSQAAAEQTRNAKHLRQRAWALAGALGLALLLVIATIWLAQVANVNAQQASLNAEQANAEADTRATAESQALAQQGTAQAERSRAEENASAAVAAQATAEAERSRANVNAANAEKQAQISYARELEMASAANLDKDAKLSILLAMQAISVSQSVDVTNTWKSQQLLHEAFQDRLVTTIPPSPSLYGGLSFTPDGKWIASGDSLAAYVWDAANGQQALRLPVTQSEARFSPDGKFLATGSSTLDMIKIWNVAGLGQAGFTPTLVLTLTASGLNPTPYQETIIAFSPDGKLLAASFGDLLVQVWDISFLGQAGFQPGQTLSQPVKTFSGIPGAWINTLAFSRDSASLVASADALEGPIASFVWDVASGQKIAEFPGWNADFDPQDANRLAISDSAAGAVVLWDIAAHQEIQRFQVGQGVGLLAFSPDGSLLAVGMLLGDAPGNTYVFDIASGALRFLFRQNDLTISLAFSPDGSRLAVSNYYNPVINIYRLVAVDEAPSAAQANPASLTGSYGVPRSAFVNLSYKTIDVYETSDWQLVTEFTPPYRDEEWGSAWGKSPWWTDQWISLVAISPEPNRLATGAGGNVVTVWDYLTGQRIFDLTLATPAMGLGYSPDGKLLATVDTKTITLWNMDTGRVQAVLTNTHGAAELWGFGLVLFSPDGTQLATVDDANFAMIWDVASQQEVIAISLGQSGANTAAFSPDGKRLATCCGTSKEVKIWDLQSGQLEHVLKGHTAAIMTCVFSPDGKYIITSSMSDNTFRVWDVASGVQLLEFQAQDRHWWSAGVFSLDGRFVEDLDLDIPNLKYTWRKFAFDLDELLKVALERLGNRWWTPEECKLYLHSDTCPPGPAINHPTPALAAGATPTTRTTNLPGFAAQW